MLPFLLVSMGCLFDSTPFELRKEALTDHDGDGVVLEDDCDDANGQVYPGAVERCDGVDQDCDGAVDEDAVDAVAWFADADADGHGSPDSSTRACQAPSGCVDSHDDCDDGDADVFPGGVERCDGEDQDCDGAADEEATDAATWYEDADGDGHGGDASTTRSCTVPSGYAPDADDCDDTDADTYPGAPDDWYDGIDSDCDGVDDFDADGDGDRADAYGGTDCDDTDLLVSGLAEEGWWDAGIDNNCDGSVDDPATGTLGEMGDSVVGDEPAGALGTTVVSLPPGWVDDEAALLVSAPLTGAGDVYGWSASDLCGGPTLVTASWHVVGAAAGDTLGLGVGWLGNELAPLVAIGSTAVGGDLGAVQVWSGGTFGGPPSLTVLGDVAGAYLGFQVVSGYDQDGDGVADLVVGAPNDPRIAPNAGSAFVFLDPPALTDGVTTSEADLEFTSAYGGAILTVDTVGDADGDGLDDLGFTQDIPSGTGPGGLLIPGGVAGGSYDVEAYSFAQLHGGPFVFGRAWDPDGDGRRTLLASSGGVYAFDLPISGAVTPWDNASASLEFDTVGPSVRWLRTDPDTWAGHTGFVLASPGFDGSTGLIAVERYPWSADAVIDGGPFLALGESAGDAGGSALASLDWDGDGVHDLAVGAPGADGATAGEGAVDLIPGPR